MEARVGKTNLLLGLLPSFPSSGLESPLLEMVFVLNIHGSQVLEEIVPPVTANDLWTVIPYKRHFSTVCLQLRIRRSALTKSLPVVLESS